MFSCSMLFVHVHQLADDQHLWFTAVVVITKHLQDSYYSSSNDQGHQFLAGLWTAGEFQEKEAKARKLYWTAAVQ